MPGTALEHIGRGMASCGCDGEDDTGHRSHDQLSRRGLFRGGIAAAGALAGAGSAGLTSVDAWAQEARPVTPDQAIRRLIRGNANFVKNTLTSIDTDLQQVRDKTALNGQRPWAAILSCADSRVPVEWAFDVVIGQVFVVRTAGNIATPENIASLEFGVGVLGCLVILVLGHGSCGAVIEARSLTSVPDTQISSLYSYIVPGLGGATTDADAIRNNARFQANVLTNSSKLLHDRVEIGSLQIVPGVYNLNSGRVSLLD
jgi:carbonic anhydrase